VISTVFISYAKEDLFSAERLYEDLRNAGVNPWIDARKLVAGQDWKHAISRAIRNSDFFIALFSKHSVTKKGFVQREIREAIDVLKQIPVGDIFFIPARLEPCQPSYEMIADLHRIDLFPEWEAGLREIRKAVQFRLENLSNEPDSTPVEISLGDDIDESYCKIRTIVFSIVSEVLRIPASKLKEEHNIWELGFDSLILVEFLSRLRSLCGVHKLSTADVFRAATLRAIILQTLISLSKDKSNSEWNDEIV
jgi:hypothetical protein